MFSCEVFSSYYWDQFFHTQYYTFPSQFYSLSLWEQLYSTEDSPLEWIRKASLVNVSLKMGSITVSFNNLFLSSSPFSTACFWGRTGYSEACTEKDLWGFFSATTAPFQQTVIGQYNFQEHWLQQHNLRFSQVTRDRGSGYLLPACIWIPLTEGAYIFSKPFIRSLGDG